MTASTMHSDSQAIRVLIADDHQLLLDGIATLLQSFPGVQLVGQASDGRQAVQQFAALQPDVTLMRAHIEQFLAHWLDPMARDHRSYVTVSIGCTGGQHRSVYLVEALARHFGQKWVTLKRHRELDAA